MAADIVTDGIYIDGEWRTTDAEIERRNPSNTDEVVSRVAKASEADASAAVESSVAAQDEWAALPQPDRGRYLHDAARELEANAEDITSLIVAELGKTRGSAAGELQRAIDLFDYYAEVARDKGGAAPPAATPATQTYTVREPLGTAAIITPWNFPIAIPAWKIAPALVAGNTVVFKPASNTPATGAALVSALEEAGLPDGVVNFVPGDGSTVGETIVTAEEVDAVSFTGSYDVGSHVYDSAVAQGKRVQTEMGGKNPLIVDDTGDLDRAVELTVDSAFRGNAGQACTATSRVLVFEDVYEAYLDRLVSATDSVTVGDPRADGIEMGPKVSTGELESDLEYIEIGQEEGARLVTGGDRLTGEGYEGGYFVEPTVFADVEPDMRIAQEEIFGPVVAVIPVSDFDHAMAVANDVEYGLSAAICTNDLARTQRFIDESETGVVKVNQTTSGVGMQLPFGGTKNSSSETYKEQGRQALDFYSHEKAVYLTHEAE